MTYTARIIEVARRHYLFLCVLAVAAILRCWNLSDMGFTYDEYSTLNRTGYHSFHELIERGIKTDTHPAFHQVFVHYWTQLVGYEAWKVKFPFLVFGLAGMVLFYVLLLNWFGKSAATLSATVLCVMQFHVYYSQTARPYTSGLFFCIALVLTCHYFIQHKNNWYRNVLLAVLFALCAYTHHFTMLFAGMVWGSLWFLMDKGKRIPLIVISTIAFLLYLPHLNIFRMQLGMGGAATSTDPPELTFLTHHVGYVFNYSWWLALSIMVIVFYGIIRSNKLPAERNKFRWLSLCWWILPIAIGYVYSILRSPLLIDRVLFFSTPFLFAFLFSFVQFKKNYQLLVSVSLIILTGFFSLTVTRQHYSTIYHTGYEEVFEKTAQAQSSDTTTLSFISAIDHVEKRAKQQCGLEHFDTYRLVQENASLFTFRKMLQESSASQVTFAWTTQYFVPKLEMLEMIREYFPCLEEQTGYTECEFYRFSKNGSTCIKPLHSFNEKNNLEYFKVNSNLNQQNSDKAVVRFEGEEFGYSLTLAHPAEFATANDLLIASVWIGGFETVPDAHLVISMDHNGKNIYWQSTKASEQLRPGDNEGRIYSSARLSNVKFPLNELEISVAIWNPDGEKFTASELTCTIEKGNANIYKHILPFTYR